MTKHEKFRFCIVSLKYQFTRGRGIVLLWAAKGSTRESCRICSLKICQKPCRLEEHVLTDHRLLHLHCWKLRYPKDANGSLHRILRVYFLQGVVFGLCGCSLARHFSSVAMKRKSVYDRKISMMHGFLKFKQRRLKGCRFCKVELATNFLFHRLSCTRSHICSCSTS